MKTTRALEAILVGVALWLAGAAFAACDQMEPIDLHFDSSLGADFRAPTDAAPADAAPADAAPDGGAGAATAP